MLDAGEDGGELLGRLPVVSLGAVLSTASCQPLPAVRLTKTVLRVSPKYLSRRVFLLSPPSIAEYALRVVRILFRLPPSLRRLLNLSRSCISVLSNSTIPRTHGATSRTMSFVVLSNTDGSR